MTDTETAPLPQKPAGLLEPPVALQWAVTGGLLLLLYMGIFPLWGKDLWNDDNYSHGLLIPFIAAYFVRQRWEEITAQPQEPTLKGLFLLLPALGLYIVSLAASEFFTQRISFIFMLFALIYQLHGKAVARFLLFPVFTLVFAVPLPYVIYNSVAFPLKLVATKIAARLLELYGMPTFIEGNIIQLVHTTLEVVDACSGIRSLMTLVTLAFFLAYLTLRPLWKKVVLLAAVIPITVLANACRVALNGILSSYNEEWIHGFYHDLTGWMVFALTFGLLAGVTMLLRWRDEVSP